jgi:hypothetical protein
MALADIKTNIQTAWAEITVISLIGVGLGYLAGTKLATTSTTKRERSACDARVATAQKESRRLGVVDARKAVDTTLNELAARQNPFELRLEGRRYPTHGTFATRREAKSAAAFLEAKEGGGDVYRVRNLAKRRKR